MQVVYICRHNIFVRPGMYVMYLRVSCDPQHVASVQVCMVGVCTVQKDVVHAGYLGIALLFFRQREQLMIPGSQLFAWLPAFNFVVMLLMIIYQVWLYLLITAICKPSLFGCMLFMNVHQVWLLLT